MTVELTVTSITVQPEISAANVVITPTFTSGGGLTAPILSISKNGVNIAPDELKNVDIEVPTKTSGLTNDSGFITNDDLSGLATKLEIESKADLVNGVVPSSQLPSYVDDVIEVANFAALPVTGESGKIYITQDDNLTYRWSGTGYAEISKSLALGETSGTAYRGDRGKTAYDHSQTTGNPHGTTASDVGASPLLHTHSGEVITPDAVTISGSYTDLQAADLAIGTMFYNTDQKCYMQKIAADVYHNFGSELPSLSKIGDNTNHLNGMPVYITSGAGNLNVVSLTSSAIGKADAMATQDILNTGDKTGFYCYFGNVHKFPRANVIKSTDNTANWVEGAELHLCSEAGKLSTEVEAAPAKCPVVARITAVNGSNITLHFIPNKGINTTDLSDWDGSTSLIADTEKLFIRKTNGVIQEITKTDFYAVLDDYFYIRQLADRTFVNQNGGTIYHITRWFTPTSALTIAANGLSATITSGQFTNAMTGAKLKLTGGVNEPIITYVSTNSINLSFAVDDSFFGQSVAVADWGVYSIEQQLVSGRKRFVSQTGVEWLTNYNNYAGANTFEQLGGGFYIDYNTMRIINDFKILFSSTGSYSGTKDLGIRRISDGLMEIYNGVTNGTLRDLKLRSLFADKIIPNSDTTGVVIRNAADGSDVVKVDTANLFTTINTDASTLVENQYRGLVVSDGINKSIKFLNVRYGGVVYSGIWFNEASPTGQTYAFLAEGNDVIFNAKSTGRVRFFANNSSKAILLSNGNFGVATDTPETRIDVNGTTTLRDWVYLNNGTHTGDAVGDRRYKVVSGVETWQRCTVLNATRGSGTWVDECKVLADGSYQFGTDTNNTTIEADGTIKFNGSATVWGDIDFPILIRTTGAGIPTLATFNGNLLMPQWAVNDFNQCESQEFVHEWKEGSTCYFHLHLDTNGLDTTDRYVKFEIEYAYSANGVWTFPAVVTTADILIPANTADRTQIIMPLFNFTPTNSKIGDHCIARLKRVASTGLAPTNNPFIPMLQMHVEKDTFGSRNMTTKL